uniref:Uncharacterized protein n=1 Tax=Eptatretus burgeri TaxID=7764 RepID=A0A8C4Q5V8_EPTBU
MRRRREALFQERQRRELAHLIEDRGCFSDSELTTAHHVHHQEQKRIPGMACLSPEREVWDGMSMQSNGNALPKSNSSLPSDCWTPCSSRYHAMQHITDPNGPPSIPMVQTICVNNGPTNSSSEFVKSQMTHRPFSPTTKDLGSDEVGYTSYTTNSLSSPSSDPSISSVTGVAIQSGSSKSSQYEFCNHHSHPEVKSLIQTNTDTEVQTQYEVMDGPNPSLVSPTSREGLCDYVDLQPSRDKPSSFRESPQSSLTGDSLYRELPRNYIVIDDISELTTNSSLVEMFEGQKPEDYDNNIFDKNFGVANDLNSREASQSTGACVEKKEEGMSNFFQESTSTEPHQKHRALSDNAVHETIRLRQMCQHTNQRTPRVVSDMDHATSFDIQDFSENRNRSSCKAERFSMGRLTLEKEAAKQLHTAFSNGVHNRKQETEENNFKFVFPGGTPVDEEFLENAPAIEHDAEKITLLRDKVFSKTFKRQHSFLGGSVVSRKGESFASDKVALRPRSSSVSGLEAISATLAVPSELLNKRSQSPSFGRDLNRPGSPLFRHKMRTRPTSFYDVNETLPGEVFTTGFSGCRSRSFSVGGIVNKTEPLQSFLGHEGGRNRPASVYGILDSKTQNSLTSEMTPSRSCISIPGEEGSKSHSSSSFFSNSGKPRPSKPRPSSVYGVDLASWTQDYITKGNNSSDGPSSAVKLRVKPSSLPVGLGSRRLSLTEQHWEDEEESPLSPVVQPMGMARASAGPLPPISAENREHLGLNAADSPLLSKAVRRLSADCQLLQSSTTGFKKQDKDKQFEDPKDCGDLSKKEHKKTMETSSRYDFPHSRIRLCRDGQDRAFAGNGFGVQIVGGKRMPGGSGDTGAYINSVLPGGAANKTGQLQAGMQVLEWNRVNLTGLTCEQVQEIVSQQEEDLELCVRLDFNMMSGTKTPDHLVETHSPDESKSMGVDPKELALELRKVVMQAALIGQTTQKSSSSTTPSKHDPSTSDVTTSFELPAPSFDSSLSNKTQNVTATKVASQINSPHRPLPTNELPQNQRLSDPPAPSVPVFKDEKTNHQQIQKQNHAPKEHNLNEDRSQHTVSQRINVPPELAPLYPSNSQRGSEGPGKSYPVPCENKNREEYVQIHSAASSSTHRSEKQERGQSVSPQMSFYGNSSNMPHQPFHQSPNISGSPKLPGSPSRSQTQSPQFGQSSPINIPAQPQRAVNSQLHSPPCGIGYPAKPQTNYSPSLSQPCTPLLGTSGSPPFQVHSPQTSPFASPSHSHAGQRHPLPVWGVCPNNSQIYYTDNSFVPPFADPLRNHIELGQTHPVNSSPMNINIVHQLERSHSFQIPQFSSPTRMPQHSAMQRPLQAYACPSLPQMPLRPRSPSRVPMQFMTTSAMVVPPPYMSRPRYHYELADAQYYGTHGVNEALQRNQLPFRQTVSKPCSPVHKPVNPAIAKNQLAYFQSFPQAPCQLVQRPALMRTQSHPLQGCSGSASRLCHPALVRTRSQNFDRIQMTASPPPYCCAIEMHRDPSSIITIASSASTSNIVASRDQPQQRKDVPYNPEPGYPMPTYRNRFHCGAFGFSPQNAMAVQYNHPLHRTNSHQVGNLSPGAYDLQASAFHFPVPSKWPNPQSLQNLLQQELFSHPERVIQYLPHTWKEHVISKAIKHSVPEQRITKRPQSVHQECGPSRQLSSPEIERALPKRSPATQMQLIGPKSHDGFSVPPEKLMTKPKTMTSLETRTPKNSPPAHKQSQPEVPLQANQITSQASSSPQAPHVKANQLPTRGIQGSEDLHRPTSPSPSSLKHQTPASATVKKRHPKAGEKKTKAGSGEVQLIVVHEVRASRLVVQVLQARGLALRNGTEPPDPFAKVYLLPGKGSEFKKKSKFVHKSTNPVWNHAMMFGNISREELPGRTLEVAIWDYDRFASNNFLGEAILGHLALWVLRRFLENCAGV